MANQREEESPERKAHIKEIARAITTEFDFATVMETGEMLVADSGVYRAGIAEAIIKREVEEAEPEESNQFTREVIGHVERSTFVEANQFDTDLNVINLQNGLYNLGTGELKPHDPLYLSRIQLPVDYDLRAAPVKIMRFLKEVLPNPDDVVNVLEDAATTLIRDARFQKAFMYIGAGANGKSVWLGILNALLGSANVSNCSIHDLQGRFAAGNLEGKLAIIYPDIAANEVTLTGKIKAIVAGDRIDVEKKGIQPFKIRPHAKAFFSANQLPIVADDSDAWFRRWRITNWLVQVPIEKQNPNLLDELTEPSELAGLFNILAAFARRLIARGGFYYQATIHQTRAEWGNRSNVIKAFVSKCLNIQMADGPELAAPSSDVYSEYIKFCLSQNFTPKKQTGFMEELKTIIPVRSEQRRVNGRGMKVLVGAELKEAPGVSSVSIVSGDISRPTDALECSSRGVSYTRNVETPETGTGVDE